MSILTKQITLIAGHYGSGKTEFAVNLALAAAEECSSVCLVDLDIVNPYFRSYERRDVLEEAGIKVLVTSNGGLADIPSLPGEIASVFVNREQRSIIDLGGDPVGARVLGFYKPQLDQVDYDFWFVLNANRPETNTPEKAQRYLENIEFMSKQKVTGIVCNTHLCGDTGPEDIVRGDRLAHALSQAAGLPHLYTLVEKRLLEHVTQEDLHGKVLPIDIYMRKPWDIAETE